MTIAVLLIKITAVLYVVAAFGYLGHLLAPRLRTAQTGLVFLALAAPLHLAQVGHAWFAAGLTPGTGFREGLSLFALALSLLYLGMQVRVRRPVLGAFVTPLVVVAMLSVLMMRPGATSVPEALRSTWLPIHISMAFLGDAALAVAAAVAVLYLILERQMKRKRFGGLFGRLPSLETLDNLNFNLVRFGFVLLSMAIITGTLWAGQVWKSYFDWEPRQTTAMVAWLLYAALIVSRWVAGWRGRRAAVITVVGFVVMVGSFVGLRLLEIGRHGGSFT